MSNLAIISQPPAIALIGDGLKFTLKNNAYVAGTAAYLSLDFQGTYADYLAGKYFDVVAGTTTIRFTFSDTPDQSGTQLLSAVSTETLADIKNRIIALLKSNYLINLDYTVALNGTSMVQITARLAGTVYNISLTATTLTVLVANATVAGVDAVIASDYRIYLAACLIANGVDGVALGEDLMPLDELQQITDNIATYLSAQLRTAFTFPYAGTNVVTLPDAVKAYFIRYAEYQNGAFQQIENTFAAPRYVLPGGLKQIDRELLTELGSDFFSYAYNAKRFLTSAPVTKTTFPGTPEKLYFLVRTTGLKVMKKAVYAASETTTEIVAIAAPAYSVIETICGMAELFTTAEQTDLLSYEIWIADAAGTVISEVRTFVINAEDYQNIRTLIFKNSFDMYDCLQCTGDLMIYDNVKRTYIQVFDNDIFRKKVAKAENAAQYILNSGYLPDKGTRMWLEDFQLSRDGFLVMGDILLPIVMTTSKLLRSRDRDDLYSLQLTFEPDYNDERYSSLVGSEGVRFVTNGYYQILTDNGGTPFIY